MTTPPLAAEALGGARARLSGVDAAKGFGIVLVVIGHTLRGVNERGLIDPTLFAVIDSRIYLFHMPFFFLINGLFFIQVLRSKTIIEYVARYATRLLWSLLLWTYIFTAMKILSGGLSNTPVTLDALAQSPIPGRWHLWFLWALLVIHLGLLVLKPFLGRLGDKRAAFGIAILAPALALALPTLPLGAARLWIGPAIANLPFFALGMVIGADRGLLEIGQRRGAALAAALALCALIALGPMAVAVGAPRGVVAAVISLCALVAFSAGPWRGLVVLGGASMAIFVAHTIFSAAWREMLRAADVTDPALHVLGGVAVGLSGPLVLWSLAGRRRRWLGL